MTIYPTGGVNHNNTKKKYRLAREASHLGQGGMSSFKAARPAVLR